MFKFAFVLQVIVGSLAVVSYDILCLLFKQKNKNIELLLLINLASQKGKHEYVITWKFGETWIGNNGLLNSFCSSILLQLESLNFWEFWNFQDGGTFISKLPTFKILFAFVILTLFKLPDPGASIYVQSFLKFPTWGAQGRSKSPPRPVVPPLGHNIDSCINMSRCTRTTYM